MMQSTTNGAQNCRLTGMKGHGTLGAERALQSLASPRVCLFLGILAEDMARPCDSSASPMTLMQQAAAA